MSDTTFLGDSTFRIKRPRITTNGSTSEPDGAIATHLDELNEMLGKRILPRSQTTYKEDAPHKEGHKGAAAEAAARAAQAHPGAHAAGVTEQLRQLLRRPLSPKHVPPAAHGGNGAAVPARPDTEWDADSLMATLAAMTEEPQGITLAEFIDGTPELSFLKYEFHRNLSESWEALSYNTRSALAGRAALADYLVALGYLVMGLEEVNGLANFVFGNRQGVKNAVDYGIVSAARTIINDEHLEVPNYNANDSQIVRKIVGAGLSVSSASFSSSLQKLVNDFVFNKSEADLIELANLNLGLPDALKPQLIQYIKGFNGSGIKITEHNVSFFLPVFAQQIMGNSVSMGNLPGTSATPPDQDFEVQYFEDGQARMQVSELAVKCAAQLFHNMVLGDELEVFSAMNYFTHKFLFRANIEITDAQLREDLHLYVFSNKFVDPRTKKIHERSRPAERQMFYRQVFNWGQGQVTEEMVVNREFPRLWKVLILESAKYIERAQISPNPNSFVSRQNVMQAVEDLQYNLSTHCTGMANVITPLIYAELNFIITRIFMHPEVLTQIVPQGGTWWRVVETLHMGMKNSRPRSIVMYNKAKLGDSILRSIARYNPASFEQDGPFSSFVSDVDAFITTQSILQEHLKDSLVRGDREEEGDGNRAYGRDGEREGRAAATAAPAPAPVPAQPADEWAF